MSLEDLEKALNFGNDVAAQLKKTDEWKCTTAANSPNGRASDCGAILSESNGLPEFLIGPACCYEWRGTIDASQAEDDKVKQVSQLFEMAGYPIKGDSPSAFRCFSPRVLERLPGF